MNTVRTAHSAIAIAKIQLATKFKKEVPRGKVIVKDRNINYRNTVGLLKDEGLLGTEFNHVLIDYKSDNAKIKQKMMTMKEAYEKNKLLRGSGFAWARYTP